MGTHLVGETTQPPIDHCLVSERGWRRRNHIHALLTSLGSSKPRGSAAYSNLGEVGDKCRSSKFDAVAALQRQYRSWSWKQRGSTMPARGNSELI